MLTQVERLRIVFEARFGLPVPSGFRDVIVVGEEGGEERPRVGALGEGVKGNGKHMLYMWRPRTLREGMPHEG